MIGKQSRYVRNHNTVKKIGKIFGFVAYAFDPEWTVQTVEGRKQIPDWLMGRLAISLKLKWIFEEKYSEELRTKQKQYLQRRIEENERILSIIPKEELDQLSPCYSEDIKSHNSNLRNQIVSIDDDIKVMKALTVKELKS